MDAIRCDGPEHRDAVYHDLELTRARDGKDGGQYGGTRGGRDDENVARPWIPAYVRQGTPGVGHEQVEHARDRDRRLEIVTRHHIGLSRIVYRKIVIGKQEHLSILARDNGVEIQSTNAERIGGIASIEETRRVRRHRERHDRGGRILHGQSRRGETRDRIVLVRIRSREVRGETQGPTGLGSR